MDALNAASNTGTLRRWFRVGHSTAADSATAGREAATDALGDDDPGLVIVFAANAHDLPTLLRTISDLAADAPVIGCSTAGEIATDGPASDSVDDEPALDTYLRMFGRTTTDVTADTFAYFAATHPLGISRRSGEEVRVVGTADFTERSVQTWSRVPRGGMTWLMEGDADTMQQAAVDPCADVVEDLGGVPPIGARAGSRPSPRRWSPRPAR